MNIRLFIALFALSLIIFVDGKKSFKSGRSSGAGRGTSRKTNYNPKPAPTSFSSPQQSAPKPSLFGWQEKPAKNAQIPKTQTHSYPSNQAKPSNNQGHSYPSSQTGLSGSGSNQPKQPPSHQENIQRNSATQNLNGPQPAPQPNTNQAGHSYPGSPGLSGNSGSQYPQQSGTGYTNQHGSNYPNQGTGISGAGTGAAPPPYPGNANKPYNGGAYQSNSNYGNNYQHPAPPPPYSNVGPGYGGYGGHGSNYYGGNGGYGSHHPGQQMPGYFGNYGGGKGFGGVSRTGSALTGVGIAGAGVGTILTGLALWNLARSTGQHRHTVIYDNRGQPVAVAPANNTTPEADSILADLVNCTLSISNGNNTEVLAIPCAIATSFTPDADVKDLGNNKGPNEDTKCTVTVVNKEGREFMTTISCSVLLNTAAENNVTEPPLTDSVNTAMTDNANGTIVSPELSLPSTADNQPSALNLTSSDNIQTNDTANLNCTFEPGEIRDPINPCFAVTQNLTVTPLQPTE